MKYSETDTLGGIFEEQARRYADREFVIYPDENLRYTYREFSDRVDRLAKGLMAIGIEKGDHVGIWAPNVPDWVTYMFASAKIGAILTPINIGFRSREFEYVLKQSDTKALVIVEGFKDVSYTTTVCELVPELLQHPRGELRSEAYPHLRSVVFMGDDEKTGMYNTAELLKLGEAVSDEDRARAGSAQTGDDVIMMQYTSGTTGFPKGVMLSHTNILNNGFYLGEGQKLTENDRLCLAVPFFHCFGSVAGVISTVTHGGSMAVLETFAPIDTLRTIAAEKCTAFYGAPVMFTSMLGHPEFSTFDLSSLRTGIMGAAPCPQAIVRKVIAEMHCSEMTVGYGLTEASPGISLTRMDDSVEKRAVTVGLPLPGIEVKIVDTETGETLGDEKPGELCCRGYNVMKGYYKMPEATAQAIDAEGWLHTGDLAMRDGDGYLRITGRIKDMIIQGGENIASLEIEEFLRTMDGVQDAQVVGVPDKKLGEMPVAFIIRNASCDLKPKAARDFCKARLARYKIPRRIFFVDEFPYNASRKVQKFKLREMARERLGIDRDIFDEDSSQ